jgi:hypothetical protein
VGRPKLASALGAVGAVVLSSSSGVDATILHNPPTWTTATNATSGMKWVAGIYNTYLDSLPGVPYGPQCTAFFYDNNTVATASHCVWGQYNGPGTPNVLLSQVGTTLVSRGAYFNGASEVKPYGACNIQPNGISVGAYTASPYPRDRDYAAIRIGSGCTLPTDWFPLSGSPSLLPSTPNTTRVAGYPSSIGGAAGKPFNLVRAPGQAWEPGFAGPNAVCHTADTDAGMSGGPVYQGLTAVGIHAWGTLQYQVGCDGNTNMAVGLDTSTRNDLLAWRAP